MSESSSNNLNNIIRQIIKKSSFTERQFEIILTRRDLIKQEFTISRGAFYRQINQCQEKFQAICYSWILFKAMGVIHEDDIDVINRLAEQVSVIKNSDVFPEREEQVMIVIQELLNRMCKL